MKGVYKITCTVNNRVYIGSSLDIDKRFLQHITTLEDDTHSNYLLKADYKLYGKDKFVYSVIEEVFGFVDRDKLYDREQYWLDNTKDKYNILTDAKAHLSKNVSKKKEDKRLIKIDKKKKPYKKPKVLTAAQLAKAIKKRKKHRERKADK